MEQGIGEDMAKNSKIEWTHHSFNPWIGCSKMSAGCANCYAETYAGRFSMAYWGPKAQRVRTSDENWRQPLRWNRQAEQDGVRRRVFCASLADIFETNEQLVKWRRSLFHLIEQTTALDWLLLTKRPENVNDMVPAAWHNAGRWPRHVWVGTSVEDQAAAEERIPHLLDVPAPVRFLSCEPLLGPVDLSRWLLCDVCGGSGIYYDEITQQNEYCGCGPALEWVIVGGESGHKARVMHPDWARTLRDQCNQAGVPFFFKQRGEWTWDYPQGISLAHRKQRYMYGITFYRVGKNLAGRELDGRTWDELPSPYHAEATRDIKLPPELEEAL